MSVPFVVQCVSCHGRLKVTDEALVGTIVACPRCGSMVQIDVPTSSSATQIGMPTQAARPDALTRPPMVMGSDPVDSQEITQGDLFDEQAIGESAQSGHANGGFAVEKPPVEPDFTDEKLSPEDWQVPSNWTSESTRKFRRRLFLGIAIAGCLLVATILGLWSQRGTKTSLTVAENSPTEPSPAADYRAETTPPEKKEVEQADPVQADPVQADPVELGETAVSAIETTGVDPHTNAETVIPEGRLPADVLAGLEGDINKTPTKKSNSVVPEQPDEPAPDPLTDLPPELASFVDLLDLPGNAPDATPVAQATVPPDDLLVDQAADAMLDPMLLATPPPEVNIANALKLRVAIQTDGYPLASFMLFCSELTQVPIQIDWFTFDLAGISISQKIHDPQPGVKPIGELLDSIASEVGAIIEQDETRLLLTLANADAQEKFASALATDDFGVEDESVKAIVQRFAGDPIWNEWEQLNLRALVTDCLRLARGMESRLPEPAISHWTVRASFQHENEATDKSIPDPFDEQWPLVKGGKSGPQLDDAITLAGLLRRTAQLNDVACIVNWDDARLRRLTPGQLVLPYADQPAGQMLAKTLAPMKLQTRAADSDHWWVGTAATYDRMPLLVISDALGPRREEILARIREAAQRADMRIFIAHDPVSDRYLSMMPRFLYRQLSSILRPFSE